MVCTSLCSSAHVATAFAEKTPLVEMPPPYAQPAPAVPPYMPPYAPASSEGATGTYDASAPRAT
jgi:hypothetical protein